jgi:hypothetical protein
VSDSFATKNAGHPLEERVQIQALSVDLKEAVMTCLSGGESCRWTVFELVDRFKSLGVCASRASVTAALADLALELELFGLGAMAPARMRDRMDLGAQIRARSVSFWRQTAPLKRRPRSFQRNIRQCSWSQSGTAKKEGVSNSLPLIGTLRRRGRLLRGMGGP